MDDPHVLDRPQLPGLFLTAPSLKDPTESRGDLHTLEAFVFVPYAPFKAWEGSTLGQRPAAYAAFKERLTQKIITTAEEIMPGLRDRLTFTNLGTPLTSAHYVEATAGNAYGTEKIVKQIGPFAFPQTTELEDLYNCGASTGGHGVFGATLSGLTTASQILRCNPLELLRECDDLQIVPADDPASWPLALQRKLKRAA